MIATISFIQINLFSRGPRINDQRPNQTGTAACGLARPANLGCSGRAKPHAASPRGASFLDVGCGSFLQTDADGPVDALLEQTLEVVADRLGIAAAKTEAVALNGRQEGIDRPELGAGG